MPFQYNPPTIDFSALAGIGQNIGGALGQHNLGTAMQEAIGPDGSYDYNKMIGVLAGRNPMLAAKLATQKSETDAENEYRRGMLDIARYNAAKPPTGDFRADPYGRIFDGNTGAYVGGGGPQQAGGSATNPHWFPTRNQDESKAGSHYKTGVAANAELEGLGNVPAEDSGVSSFASGITGPIGEGMTGAVANSFVSAKRQQFKNSASALINAFNRRDSGAQISASEWRNAEELYIPKYGDDEKTVAQKALRRKRKLESIAGEAGPLFDPSAAAPEPIPTADPAPAPAPTSAPTPVRTSTVLPDGTVVPPTEASAAPAARAAPSPPPKLRGRTLQFNSAMNLFRDKATGEFFNVNGDPVASQ
jgi:hypothetical protein